MYDGTNCLLSPTTTLLDPSNLLTPPNLLPVTVSYNPLIVCTSSIIACGGSLITKSFLVRIFYRYFSIHENIAFSSILFGKSISSMLPKVALKISE